MTLHLFKPLPLRRNQSIVVAICTAVAIVALSLFASTQPTEAQSIETVVREIQVTTNDIAYDPVGDRLYVSVPSKFGQTGNSIIQINPNTLTPSAPIHVGSEPERMTISDDGKYLYVALGGASAVRRIDLATQTAGPEFTLGNSVTPGPFFPTNDGTWPVHDLKVMPGDSNRLVIVGAPGPSIFTNGIKAPAFTTSPGHRIVFGANASTAYGVNFHGFFSKYSIDGNGISVVKTTNPRDPILFSPTDIEFGGGFIYATTGQKIDPEVPKEVGTFSGPAPGDLIYGVVPDTQADRLYVLSASPTCNTCTFTASIQAFDLATLAPIGTIQIPGCRGTTLKRLVRWGSNGLAFNTNANQLFVLRTSLVPSNAPVSLPSPTHPTRITPVSLTGTIREISLPNNDLIYDPQRAVIYATVPGFAGPNGNSVIAINPVTGGMGVPKVVGPNPTVMAMSSDNKYLWVAMFDEQKVRRLNLQSNSVDVEFGIQAPNPNQGFVGVTDMAVFPDDPESVVVGRLNPAVPGLSPGILVYKNGTLFPAPIIRSGHTTIETSNEPGVFYAADTQSVGTTDYTRFHFGKPSDYHPNFTIDYICNFLLGGFSADIKFDEGRLYDRFGKVVNPQQIRPVGRFDLGETMSRPYVLPYGRAFHAYFLHGFRNLQGWTWTLVVFDTRTFVPIATMEIPNVKGEAGSLIRWGTDGLAFGTEGNQIFLIQSPFFKAPAGPLELGIETAGPSNDQAAAINSVLFTRDPFRVLTTHDWFHPSSDRNTRVTLFARNLELAPGETSSSVVIEITDSGNQTFSIPAEDVRKVPGVDLTQIVLRLPDNTPAGVYGVVIKAQGRVSNAGKLRLAQ